MPISKFINKSLPFIASYLGKQIFSHDKTILTCYCYTTMDIIDPFYHIFKAIYIIQKNLIKKINNFETAMN